MYASTKTLCATLAMTAALFAATPGADAHGYMSSPPPRGIEKAGSQIDALRNPNHNGVCRGESSEGKVTDVQAGSSLTIDMAISAHHYGPCVAFWLSDDLSQEIPIASEFNCGYQPSWTVQLPKELPSGKGLLRWYWEGWHLGKDPSVIERFENCADINVSGGDGSAAKSATADRPGSDLLGDGSAATDPTSPDANRNYNQLAGASGGSSSSGGTSAAAPAAAGTTTAAAAAPTTSQSSAIEVQTYAAATPSALSADAAAPSASVSSDGSLLKVATTAGETVSVNTTSVGPIKSANGAASGPGTCDPFGAYQCTSDTDFRICTNSGWVTFTCGDGTRCTDQYGQIYCGYPN